LLASISVPRLGAAARWGYHKLCRKPGEFAHALAAFVVDPDRDLCRLAIGATETRPIVVADARAVLGDATAPRFDAGAADRLMAAAGMTDALDRQLHVVALRHAIEGSQAR
jgi:carbon-monoxide dehydrogenase medium subunit